MGHPSSGTSGKDRYRSSFITVSKSITSGMPSQWYSDPATPLIGYSRKKNSEESDGLQDMILDGSLRESQLAASKNIDMKLMMGKLAGLSTMELDNVRLESTEFIFGDSDTVVADEVPWDEVPYHLKFSSAGLNESNKYG
jgi:hypothetical protein